MDILLLGFRLVFFPDEKHLPNWRARQEKGDEIGSMDDTIAKYDEFLATWPDWFVETVRQYKLESHHPMKLTFILGSAEWLRTRNDNVPAHHLGYRMVVKREPGESRREFREKREGHEEFHPSVLPANDEWMLFVEIETQESDHRCSQRLVLPMSHSPVSGEAISSLAPIINDWCAKWDQDMARWAEEHNQRVQAQKAAAARRAAADARAKQYQSEPPKYLAIVEGEKVVGICTSSEVMTVVGERDNPTFRALTQEEFHEIDAEGLPHWEAKLLARDVIKIEMRFQVL